MIILDTNFLVYVMKYRIAYELENKDLAVLLQTVRELEILSGDARKGSDKDAAKLALKLIKEWKIKIIEADGNADDAILKTASEKGAKVATLDKELTGRLIASGIKVLKIRQKKKIIEG